MDLSLPQCRMLTRHGSSGRPEPPFRCQRERETCNQCLRSVCCPVRRENTPSIRQHTSAPDTDELSTSDARCKCSKLPTRGASLETHPRLLLTPAPPKDARRRCKLCTEKHLTGHDAGKRPGALCSFASVFRTPRQEHRGFLPSLEIETR